MILFTLAYTYLSFLVVIAYINHWDLSVNPKEWPMPVQLAEFTLEVVYDVLAISLLISIHHKHFKPKPKKRVKYEFDEETGYIEDESENEHVSVYEDD